MASRRLKKEDKVNIHNTVLEAASKDRMEALMARENQVARMVYLQAIEGYGKHVQAVPDGFFQDRGNIGVKLYKKPRDMALEKNATTYARAKLSVGWRANSNDFMTPILSQYSGGEDMELGEEMRMPHKFIYKDRGILVTTDIGLEIQALIFAQKELHDDLVKLSETVKKALMTCNTVKKLLEEYPELKAYAPADIANTTLAVAHGRIDELIKCTKKADCDEKPKPKSRKKAKVIHL